MTSSRLKAFSAGFSRSQLFGVAATVLVLFSLVLRYLLLDRTSINWDEFHFLNHVYLTAEGEQTRAVQTFHGRLLGWLTGWPGHEADQVVAGRHVMFTLVAVSCGLWAFVGYRLIGGSAGLFAAFVAGSFAYALGHSTAFRFDPLLMSSFAGSAALLLTASRPRLSAALAGGLFGLAIAVSLKAALFAPALLALVGLPILVQDHRRSACVRVALFATGAIATATVLLAVHSLGLSDGEATVGLTISDAAGKAVDLGNLLPQPIVLTESLSWDAPMWLLMAIGLVLLIVHAVRGGDRVERVRALQILALATPLVTLGFYRNSYPYYYPTILPGACLLAGYLWHSIETLRRPLVAVALAATCALPVAYKAARWFSHNDDNQTTVQRYVVDAVHQVFAEPVPYMDRAGMISSFDKVGPLMSTWVMSGYQRRQELIVPELLRTEQPVFILANSPGLELWRPWQQVPAQYRFLPGDYQALRQNFIPHWGPILVAGKSVRLSASEAVAVDIVIAGPYTVEAAGPVVIDGKSHQPGDVAVLEPGPHEVVAADATTDRLTLRYGDRLPRPAGQPIAAPIFQPFSLGRP